ncbi:thioredoxin family protein [Muricauda sp. CAU 1633]|uniref:thioredoxin family protein n=1 Tax=Allomuricauda sp. CAU 1633 TaxID=2816036 RepID=UPI001A8F2319|nr:thioredoxin family protein [Muricauda sp. CAU 1633]MBO0321309.1 thioredoxin family protein [Muricauda sp. CAU 1633]
MELLEKHIQQDKPTLVQQGISMGMDYEKYRDLVHHLVEIEQTTGHVQTEANVHYTQLNDRRMKRWDKTFAIPDEIQQKIINLKSKLAFLTITESWCGDAAHSMPIINKISELNPNMDHKVVLRDEVPEIMDAFLTQGARSIPKVILWDKENKAILGEWGPRPNLATQMVEDYKKEYGKLTPEFKQDLQVWYNKDKGVGILNDILDLLPLE